MPKLLTLASALVLGAASLVAVAAPAQAAVYTPPALRQSGLQLWQASGVTRQAWAKASRSTDAAASPRPRGIDGRRANA